MTPADNPIEDDIGVSEIDTDQVEESKKLDLDVDIRETAPCERHVTVTVARQDIDRYLDDQVKELIKTAQVPGFRPGKVPRKLLEKKFRKELHDQIKSSLLVDALTQVSEDHQLAAIGEPDFDPNAIEIPDEGPLTFEFEIEVRPDFDLPDWKGLEIRRPNRDITEEDIDERLTRVVAEDGTFEEIEGPAKHGDYVVVSVSSFDGEVKLGEKKEKRLQLLPTLGFYDGRLDGFDKLMEGVRPGDERSGEIQLSEELDHQELRGKTIQAKFKVHKIERLKLPELTPEYLSKLGEVEDEAGLRERIKEVLQRQLNYQQQQAAREQVLEKLLAKVDLELPEPLLRRQASRELQRSLMELQSAGFSDEEIRAREAQLRQSARSSTARSLKEHFVLERIAEEEDIDATEQDYEYEIMMIAMQTRETPRKVRAQIEKQGHMDALRNQIVERKVLDMIIENAKFVDEPFEFEKPTVTSLDWAASGIKSEEGEMSSAADEA